MLCMENWLINFCYPEGVGLGGVSVGVKVVFTVTSARAFAIAASCCTCCMSCALGLAVAGDAPPKLLSDILMCGFVGGL
jgi:hypothetical protein